MSATKLLAVVSDMHCGSAVGLACPEFELEGGNVVGFGKNAFQAWLWACWNEALQKVFKIADDDEFALAVNGDATEGIHHGGAQIIAQKIEEHAAVAVSCLMPWVANASKVYMTRGTECHTREIEHLVAEKVKAQTGRARDKWLLDIHGCLVDIAHHMPTSGRRYLEAGALSITLGNARLNYADAGQRVPRVFLRGHRHCGGWYSSGHAAIGVTGGFQALTRHGHKVVTDSIPHPSVIVLDWRGKPSGELPQCHLIKFDPPAHEITKIV